MRFQDRLQAAELLARKLQPWANTRPLVLGIPRGSVPMAQVVANRLGGDLDVVLAHKIGAPDNPEYAIGSVSEFGDIHASEGMTYCGVSRQELERLAAGEITRLRQRRRAISSVRPPVDPKGRSVILVDDGIATGSTVLAALRALRARGPRELVVAAPVASPSALDRLRPEADALVVLEVSPEFRSVGQFYDSFPQVSDAEVLDALAVTRRQAG